MLLRSKFRICRTDPFSPIDPFSTHCKYFLETLMLNLEVTTHNLYFHEQSSIFSIDSHGDLICTGGGDGVARLWKIIPSQSNNGINNFNYCTALNSSTKIDYISDVHTHSKAVNCVRFNSRGDIASCSDGGKVLVNNSTVREADGKDCFDLLWIENYLVVGTICGLVEVFLVGDVPKRVESKKIHSDIVQGLAYSPLNKLLVTVSKDNNSSLLLFNEENGKIKILERMENKFFANSRGFYRRISFSKDQLFLYLVSSKNNCLNILSHPFRDEHLFVKIGPLDSEVIRVIEDDYFYVITKKSVYIFKDRDFKVCVENISFKSTTDATICNNILFVTSLDGFIASVKIPS